MLLCYKKQQPGNLLGFLGHLDLSRAGLPASRLSQGSGTRGWGKKEEDAIRISSQAVSHVSAVI